MSIFKSRGFGPMKDFGLDTEVRVHLDIYIQFHIMEIDYRNRNKGVIQRAD